ncbi:PTS fructose transporter subunit IIB [Geosporobacter ferrireducens]|uniref:PTS fructose transporter subunit IIB n=1 Tax=Geosporobacter ferrireducens TaxID=1424294 RepID=A0A1D8GHM4_9FIRM|nr:PTS fructose transporter subunit IIB [Geosporobacter ferrireducens]AOT70386.1 PTS fructose transporter subunit IIB [Geosporobacter ferrireducens]MTI57228.1 PTS fructose transporter subunit IIB [Geosporobacter ferrireducens]
MSKKLIALCACPMGLAHTFMAAQAIKKVAEEMGYEVKVETQGADGIKNELTTKDIKEADIIIHAIAVTPMDVERFDNYTVHEVTLQEVIKDAKGVIQAIEASK